jgi:hypothetical protein
MAATPLAMIATAREDLLRPAALTTRSSQRKLPGASAQVIGQAAGHRGLAGPVAEWSSYRSCAQNCISDRLLGLHFYTSQPYAEMRAHAAVRSFLTG